MIKIKYFLLLICTILLFSCEDEKQFDAEVIVGNIYYSSMGDGSVRVEYRMRNIGTNDISGWKVYFNVSFELGPQVVAEGKTTCDLAPGDTSKVYIAFNQVPNQIPESARIPISASVKNLILY